MQTDLRLLLLIISVVLGGLIIFKAFRERRERAPQLVRQQFEKSIMENAHRSTPIRNVPDLHMAESDPLLEDYQFTSIEIEKKHIPSAEVFEKTPPVDVKEKKKSVPQVFALTILPRDEVSFSGETLQTLFEEQGLVYGKNNFFERHQENDPVQRVIYRIASIVEPGIFKYDHMPYETYRGVVLWIISSDKNGELDFETMLHEAKEISEFLNGTVCDEKRQQLTVQGTSHIRLKLREALAG